MTASMSALAVLPKTRSGLALASLALIAALAGCEAAPTPPPLPPPPRVVEAAPPPPVLLPRGVVEMASVYEAYASQTSAIDPGFTGGDKIAESLRTAAHYQIDQFQRGQTAYGAIVALQDPTFLSSLREFAKDPDRRAQVANAIMADPAYATQFKGADSAAGLVIAAFSDQGRKLMATGGRIHQAAYDVQHQSWSKADVADRPGRLALAKSLSETPLTAAEGDAQRLSQNVSGAQPMGVAASPAAGPYTPLVARSLAVAAMAALGEGGEEYAPQLTALLAEANEGQCLTMAKLNLYQCLAVARPQYEDVFCMGQHAVSDTGMCVMKSAVVGYGPPPPVIAPTPVTDTKLAVQRKKKKTKVG